LAAQNHVRASFLLTLPRNICVAARRTRLLSAWHGGLSHTDSKLLDALTAVLHSQMTWACRKVCAQVKRWSDWVGLWTGLPSWGPRELRSHPVNATAICKLCDRPAERATLDALSPEEQGDYFDKRHPLRGNTPAAPSET
jgi:hypothetical protein